MDHRYVKIILKECKTQDAMTPEEVARFAVAYTMASDQCISMEQHFGHVMVRRLANIIVPETGGRYRKVPVHFSDPTWKGLDHPLIHRAMDNLLSAAAKGYISADEFYQEFQKIHPFTDGNGRVGHILWKILKCRDGVSWDPFAISGPPMFLSMRVPASFVDKWEEPDPDFDVLSREDK